MALGKQFQQLQLFNPDDPEVIPHHEFSPVDFVKEGMEKYNQDNGLGKLQHATGYTHVDPLRGHLQYLAYRNALRQPEDTPGADASYAAATEHINKQYEYMTKPVEEGGLGITHEVTTDDPYPDAASMADDLRTNRRIRTFATATTNAGGAQEGQAATLQAFDNDTNDRFRAVHDVIGHGGTGRGFSRNGEEAAYRLHMQTFPPEALPAIASELRGQNSYLNYSPEHQFPDVGSRMITMPDWASGTDPIPVEKPKARKKASRALPKYKQDAINNAPLPVDRKQGRQLRLKLK